MSLQQYEYPPLSSLHGARERSLVKLRTPKAYSIGRKVATNNMYMAYALPNGNVRFVGKKNHLKGLFEDSNHSSVSVSDMCFFGNGDNRFCVALTDGFLAMLDLVPNGTKVVDLHPIFEYQCEKNEHISRVAFMNVGTETRAFVATTSGDFVAFDVGDDEPVKKLWSRRVQTEPVNDISISLSGTKVVTGSANGTVCVWNTESFELENVLRPFGFNKPVFSCRFVGGGDNVILAGNHFNSVLQLWSVEKEEKLAELHFEKSEESNDIMNFLDVDDSTRTHIIVSNLYRTTLALIRVSVNGDESDASFGSVIELVLRAPVVSFAMASKNEEDVMRLGVFALQKEQMCLVSIASTKKDIFSADLSSTSQTGLTPKTPSNDSLRTDSLRTDSLSVSILSREASVEKSDVIKDALGIGGDENKSDKNDSMDALDVNEIESRAMEIYGSGKQSESTDNEDQKSPFVEKCIEVELQKSSSESDVVNQVDSKESENVDVALTGEPNEEEVFSQGDSSDDHFIDAEKEDEGYASDVEDKVAKESEKDISVECVASDSERGLENKDLDDDTKVDDGYVSDVDEKEKTMNRKSDDEVISVPLSQLKELMDESWKMHKSQIRDEVQQSYKRARREERVEDEKFVQALARTIAVDIPKKIDDSVVQMVPKLGEAVSNAVEKGLQKMRSVVAHDLNTKVMSEIKSHIDNAVRGLSKSLKADETVARKLEKSVKESVESVVTSSFKRGEKDTVKRLEASLDEKLSAKNLQTLSIELQASNAAEWDRIHEKLDLLQFEPENAQSGYDETELRRIIQDLLDKEEFESVFEKVLRADNLKLVEWVICSVPPEVLLRHHLSHPILLSLIQQLAFDLSSEMDTKLRWLQDSVMALDADDPCFRQHGQEVLRQATDRLKEKENEFEGQNLRSYKILTRIISSLMIA